MTEVMSPWIWTSLDILILAGHKIQTTHTPLLVTSSLATVEPYPGQASNRAWLPYPLQNQSILGLALLDSILHSLKHFLMK